MALFVDPEMVTDEALDALFRWSAKLNTEGRKRMVILPLWDAGPNIEGFCRVALEKNARPWGGPFVEASAGALTDCTSWEDLGGTVGSVVLISSGADPSSAGVLPESLSEKPQVVIDPFKRASALKNQVVVPTALPGLESDGIFFRADGLPFTMNSVEIWNDQGYPTVRNVLADLTNEGL